MENNPVDLLFYRNPQGPGIIPNPVNTDIDLPGNGAILTLRKVKTDDIGVEIML